MSELNTVPTCLFNQKTTEPDILILYWREDVELCQGDTKLVISIENIDRLFKTIKRHLPDAQELLNSK